MIPVEIWTGMIVKLLGAAAGAALALVFVPPKTYLGFIRRVTASLIGGLVFAAPAQEFIRFTPNWEGLLGGACLAAFASWWAMGTVIRVLRLWKPNV